MLPFASANDDAADYVFAIDDDEPFPHIYKHKEILSFFENSYPLHICWALNLWDKSDTQIYGADTRT